MTKLNADYSGGALAAEIARELAAADPLADEYAKVTAQNTEVEQNNRVVPDQQVASDEAADPTAPE